MKNRTLRRAAETLVLLLIAAMAVFLAAGLHQRAPDGTLSTLSTGWYQLTDGVRREVTLPAALETGPGQTITLYNDTLTDSDGGKVLSARGVEYGIEIRAGETLLYRYDEGPPVGGCGASGQHRRTDAQPDPDAALRPHGRARRARSRHSAGRHRPPYPVLAVLHRHDARHARARRARAADLLLHELFRHPRASLSRCGGLSAAVQPVELDGFRPVTGLRQPCRELEHGVLLRIRSTDGTAPPGASFPSTPS